MRSRRQSYVRGGALLACFAAIFLGGVLAARAFPGASEASSLSFVGVLRQDNQPLVGQHDLVFTFKKGGTAVCSSPSLQVTADDEGRFQVQIPMSGCPASLLDGSAVTVDIAVGSQIAASELPISAVPYAFHANQLGTSDCPAGYDRGTAGPSIVLCTKGVDEVVRVGTGSTAFWIDRYEGSIWSDVGGTAVSYGGGGQPDYPATFPTNGQVSLEAQLYGISKRGIAPSSNLTWFQANQACRASGKRLPTSEEWLTAATGTLAVTGAAATDCNIQTGVKRITGNGSSCVSRWGAEDMVGNMAEFMSEFALGVNSDPTATFGSTPNAQFPVEFGSDRTWGVTSVSWNGLVGLSNLLLRGGTYYDGDDAGIFAFSVTTAVVGREPIIGFRCVIAR